MSAEMRLGIRCLQTEFPIQECSRPMGSGEAVRKAGKTAKRLYRVLHPKGKCAGL